jgi:hypothetical protein
MNELFIGLGAVALVFIVAWTLRNKSKGKGGSRDDRGDINKPK